MEKRKVLHVFIFLSTAPDLIASLQERQKNHALALLERAKEICAQDGVSTSLDSFNAQRVCIQIVSGLVGFE